MLGPSVNVSPPVRAHKSMKGLANSGRPVCPGCRPLKVLIESFADGDKVNARAELGHTKVGCIEKCPVRPVAFQLARDEVTIVLKNGIHDSSDVFNDDGARLDFLYDFERSGKEIPLRRDVLVAYRLWRTADKGTGSHNIHTDIWTCVKGSKVLFNYVPVWSIMPEGLAGVRVEFPQGRHGQSRLVRSLTLVRPHPHTTRELKFSSSLLSHPSVTEASIEAEKSASSQKPLHLASLLKQKGERPVLRIPLQR